MENHAIPRINTQVCLGVNLDENLSWASHIEMICKKASSGIGAIKRIKPFVPMHTLESIYKILFSLTLTIVPLFGTRAGSF